MCACLQGYEIHMFDSALNLTAYLGNTTDNFFKVSNLKMGHNYTFTVQARCLFGSQICGEPAVLLYDELSSGELLRGRPVRVLFQGRRGMRWFF